MFDRVSGVSRIVAARRAHQYEYVLIAALLRRINFDDFREARAAPPRQAATYPKDSIAATEGRVQS
jgi:hypothetical protein